MGINFPNTPTVGQIYPSPATPGVPQWKWDGNVWTPTSPPATSVLRGYISGLTLSTAGSSTTFSVAVGIATDSTAVDTMSLLSSISKTTSGWVAGTGQGALDTGAIANNTWYHVHLIKRPDTGNVDVLISLSPNNPTLPTNYTLARRIGSMRTNASGQWTAFVQVGNQFTWVTNTIDYSNTAIPTTPTLFTLSVPTGVQVLALYIATMATSAQSALMFSTVETPTAVSSGHFNVGYLGAQYQTLTNTSAQIYGQAAAASNIYLFTTGWIDNRGADVAISHVTQVYYPVVRGLLQGLTLSTAGSSTAFSVAAGLACDSTAVDNLLLPSALSKSTSAWASGNGAGALDSGAIANNTWYHAFVIKNPTTTAVDVLVSLSPTAPTLPSGYTLFRRIGSMKTNASGQWTLFSQFGDDFLWTVTSYDANNVNPGSSPTLYTLNVPTGVNVAALYHAAFTNTAAGHALYLFSGAQTGPTLYSLANATASGISAGDFRTITSISGQIQAMSDVASGTSLYLATYGWTDRRGRDA
jgi:hypothetical protein